MKRFLFLIFLTGTLLEIQAQSLKIYTKEGDEVHFNVDGVDYMEISPETEYNSPYSYYAQKYCNFSSIISGLQSGNKEEKLFANRYIDKLLKNYESYENVVEYPDFAPVISISDDDTIDPQLDGLLTGGKTGGFFSALYPLAASLGAPVTESVEGHRCGLNVGKLTTSGIFAKLLVQHAGWELANHTMDAKYGGALLVKSFSEIPSVDRIPSPVGFLTDKKYVYVENENKCYYYNNGWIPVEEHKEPPFLMNSAGKAISDNPCFNFEYEVWRNQDMMESLMGFRPVTYVQPVNQSSKKRAEYVKASHKFMMNKYSDKAIELPLSTTIERLSLDDAEGSSNEATDELFQQWKNTLNDVLHNGKSIVLLLHAYRSCWSNYLENQLVSNGGAYPDEWVYPTKLPTYTVFPNKCARLQNKVFRDYIGSTNYDLMLVRITNGAKKLVLDGGKPEGFFFFDSNSFSPSSFLAYNKDGIVPDNACLALCNLKKTDNPNGCESIKMQYNLPVTLNHCARIVADGTYKNFRDYVTSSNYDCLHVKLDTPVKKIVLKGAKVTGGYFFFSSYSYGKNTFVGFNTNGIVPSGAKYAIVNFKKENNVQGYNGLLLEEVPDMTSQEWMTPSIFSQLNNWSEWYPCPGTRLYQLWKFLNYAKDCGVTLLTIAQNLERMENRVEGGYFVRTRQNAFEEIDNNYYIEDYFGNIYLHRKDE